MRSTAKRRVWLGAFAAVATAAAVAVGLGGGSGRSGEPRPDLVVVVVDTMRADRLGVYGHERETSPRIDALAERGLVFERAFAHSGWTLPSTASLLTGLYPAEHRAVRDARDHATFGALPKGVRTLAGTLRDTGYRTAAFVNNVFLAPDFALDRGFERYDYRGSTNSEHRSAGATVEAALEWLDDAEEERPSFALVHLMEPHIDYDPPEALHKRIAPADPAVEPPVSARKVAELSDGESGRPSPEQQRAISRIYEEEILAVDGAIGRLASAVDARSRPSWIWITSDHGEELWDHGSFEHGHHLHGELVRVPLIAVGPDVDAGRVGAPVQHVDLFRTLVQLGGGKPPPQSHGTDLLRVASEPELASDDRPVLHEGCLYGPSRAALTSGSWRVVVELPSRRASLWRLDGRGQKDELVVDEDLEEEHLRPLLAQLFELRGSREAPTVTTQRAVDDLGDEEIEQLRSLGYVQ